MAKRTNAGNRTAPELVAALLPAVLLGCTSFGAVRSAEVRRGASVTLQATATTPAGDEAGWFWSYDCASNCGHSIPNFDIGVTFGRPAEDEGGPGYALGVGWSGIVHPYVDGYVQLRGGRRPLGVGARVGIPLTGWNEYLLYGRYDLDLERGARLLLNPGVYYHAGNSPNGQNPGRFLALVQGIGWMREGERVTLIPSLSLVLGRGRRESYGESLGSFSAVIAVASMSVTLHGNRE